MSDLLPPNATTGERAMAAATARIGDVPVPLRTLWDPQACPEVLLPWLAWAVGVVQWSPAWTVAERRAAIAQAIAIHRHSGTVGALRRALSVLDYTIDVIEWWQLTPPGVPGTFALDVQLAGKPIESSLIAEAIRIANAAKNLRSHLVGLRLIGRVVGRACLGAHVYAGAEHTIGPLTTRSARIESPTYMSATAQSSAVVQIDPAG